LRNCWRRKQQRHKDDSEPALPHPHLGGSNSFWRYSVQNP
jgi:hypothetical protein